MCVAFGWEISSPKLSVLKRSCYKFVMANLYGDRDFYWESHRYGLYTMIYLVACSLGWNVLYLSSVVL